MFLLNLYKIVIVELFLLHIKGFLLHSSFSLKLWKVKYIHFYELI